MQIRKTMHIRKLCEKENLSKLGNMFDIGIIDPAKVTRSTLQNAASIASMVLTTECIIVDKPSEEGLT